MTRVPGPARRLPGAASRGGASSPAACRCGAVGSRGPRAARPLASRPCAAATSTGLGLDAPAHRVRASGHMLTGVTLAAGFVLSSMQLVSAAEVLEETGVGHADRVGALDDAGRRRPGRPARRRPPTPWRVDGHRPRRAGPGRRTAGPSMVSPSRTSSGDAEDAKPRDDLRDAVRFAVAQLGRAGNSVRPSAWVATTAIAGSRRCSAAPWTPRAVTPWSGAPVTTTSPCGSTPAAGSAPPRLRRGRPSPRAPRGRRCARG